ncbi:MAG: nuclear transport factor 2 family protein [Solirubrobacterales bacterium]|nr:nuclear transport factor 2 family protein [Solirubrobacterales bacterium]MBV9165798.1 nuclear transport factor 2 family protein [Solirubrobacterales bacterium]MBV9536017.1 nuclear transport factor 2 family protein [Solirubrobacterales bacterium]
MSKSNVDLARHGYEAAARGDLDAIAGLLDPDVKWHAGDPNAEYACRNREEALRFMHRAERRGPGELLDVIDAGEKVVVIMRRPDEADRSSTVANVATFRNGKVIEMVHYPDPGDALRAAGVED